MLNTNANDVVKLKQQYKETVDKLSIIARASDINIDKAVELFGMNASDIRETFLNACKLLNKSKDYLNKKLNETIIDL